MTAASAFRCTACDARYPQDRPRYRCDCGGRLDLPPADATRLPVPIAATTGPQRFAPILPLPADRLRIDLGERDTPLLEETIGDHRWRLKVEATLPTGSFKDRGTVVLVNALAGWGVKEVAADSSGNAAASLAAYCARAGIRAVIFVPATASPVKLHLIESFGAEVRRVEAGRAAAAERAVTHGATTFYAGHATHPLFLHGVKTIAYEIVQQLGAAPERLVVPVGNGTLLLGAALGFDELHAAGRIDTPPRLFGVQAARCAPLAARFAGRDPAPPSRPTCAEGIAITAPPRADEILAAVQRTGGQIVSVPEQEIGPAHAALAHRGLLVEPTSAVPYAAILNGSVPPPPSGTGCLVLTGTGLKTLPV